MTFKNDIDKSFEKHLSCIVDEEIAKINDKNIDYNIILNKTICSAQNNDKTKHIMLDYNKNNSHNMLVSQPYDNNQQHKNENTPLSHLILYLMLKTLFSMKDNKLKTILIIMIIIMQISILKMKIFWIMKNKMLKFCEYTC